MSRELFIRARGRSIYGSGVPGRITPGLRGARRTVDNRAMPNGAPCPPRAKLEALVTSELPAEETAELAAHVERCDRCTAEVGSIAGDRAHVRRGGRERRLIPGA